MKYCVLIIDGAADWPIPERRGKTCLELAHTPNLDTLAREGMAGLAHTVPAGMEPSSACACMSILGYDPTLYYCGRGAIEAKSMGINLCEDEIAFRCNLVAVRSGHMWSYSSGNISSDESHQLIVTLQEELGSNDVRFYPGVGYRHICTIKGQQDTLQAMCTPPHDISDKPIAEFLPHGPGSIILRDLMARSEYVLKEHPVNIKRQADGNIPSTMIWLFWGGRKALDLPPFDRTFGLSASMTSAVDLLQGLADMTGIVKLSIAGVTAGFDNDYVRQTAGALEAFSDSDVVIIHIESPDEAGHEGHLEKKIKAIELVDKEVAGQLISWHGDSLRILAMPDHPTPVSVKTHVSDPVPFVLWGEGIRSNGANAFSETEAAKTGLLIHKSHILMGKLLGI